MESRDEGLGRMAQSGGKRTRAERSGAHARREADARARATRFGRAAVGAACALLLAITFVAGGFFAVAGPDWATIALSQAFSGKANPSTPFTEDELLQVAVAGKRYTFDDNDPEKLSDALAQVNRSAEEDGRAPALSGTSAQASDARTFPADALSHLDDVYGVVRAAKPALAAIALAAVGACALVGTRSGRRALAGALIGAGALVLAAFAALAAWAALDFTSLFAAFHSLFFAEGTWVFSSTSLLITVYPTAFWMGMGAIWLVATCALSAASIAAGLIVRRKRR